MFKRRPIPAKVGLNPIIKNALIQDRPNPPKRPSRKPKRVRVQMAVGKARAKENLNARAQKASNESAIAKALHGPRAKSRRKKQRDTKAR